MFRASGTPRLSHFASHKFRTSFYFARKPDRTTIHEHHTLLSAPKIDEKFNKASKKYNDKVVDLREKEHLELSEAMRGERERDFYMDHTYHDEWVQRDVNHEQSKQLMKMYPFMVPGSTVSPWIWYPGDIVEVVTGPFTGQRGAITTVLKHKSQIMVQNVNVKAITIPASESRPEQIMQREHPISVKLVKHVDPSTNEVCDVRLIAVRDRETGRREERRVSLTTGVLLPIPKDATQVYEGDPLHDTPLSDAEEDTYDEANELPVIVERKLKALEDHFVDGLKQAHEYHQKLEAQNATELFDYQYDVIERAASIVAQRLAADDALLARVGVGAEPLPEAAAAAEPATEG